MKPVRVRTTTTTMTRLPKVRIPIAVQEKTFISTTVNQSKLAALSWNSGIWSLYTHECAQ